MFSFPGGVMVLPLTGPGYSGEREGLSGEGLEGKRKNFCIFVKDRIRNKNLRYGKGFHEFSLCSGEEDKHPRGGKRKRKKKPRRPAPARSAVARQG